MESFVFEEVNEKHLPEIADIYNHYILNTTVTFHTQALSVMEMKDIVLTNDPRFKAFVILDDEIICGYCLLAPFKKREAYDRTAEVTIYLKLEYTGKGIGSKATGFLEKIAAAKGFHVLLAVICSENTASVNLFEKQGFEKCAHYREIGMKFGRLLDVLSYQKII